MKILKLTNIQGRILRDKTDDVRCQQTDAQGMEVTLCH